MPLLQHALLELWHRRRGPWLTLDAYDDIGGVGGALARRADATYVALSPPQQHLARMMLLRLITFGEGVADTRRRVHRDELYPVDVDPDDVDAVIHALSAEQARLIVADADTVEITHETLLREWDALRSWLDADREAQRVHRRLTHAAAEWTGPLNRDPVAPHDPDRFGKCLASTSRVEMVKRTQQEHRVGGAIRRRQVASVAETDGERLCRDGGPLSLLYVQGHGVDQFDVVAVRREPACMRTGAASDVEDRDGRRWEHTPQHFLCPRELQLPVRSTGQPVALVGDAVVRRHVGIQWPRHLCNVTPTVRRCVAGPAISSPGLSLRHAGPRDPPMSSPKMRRPEETVGPHQAWPAGVGGLRGSGSMIVVDLSQGAFTRSSFRS